MGVAVRFIRSRKRKLLLLLHRLLVCRRRRRRRPPPAPRRRPPVAAAEGIRRWSLQKERQGGVGLMNCTENSYKPFNNSVALIVCSRTF